jgi:phage terminase large subunit GpA-like protein
LPLGLEIMEFLKPPPKLSVSEWADQERILTRASSPFPGKWKTSRAEYQRGIMDAFSDPKIQKIVCMMGSQLGKTECMNSILGFFITHDPCPVLVLQPTLEMARAWSQDRLAPMIQTTPALAEQISDPKAKDGDNTITQKLFKNGARLSIAGSNSPANLASRPIRVVLMDEVDRMPPSAGTEGSPIQLAIRRTANFFNRKIFLCSTPTVKGESVIETQFQESDQRFYFLKCPKCSHSQTLIWSRIKWPQSEPQNAQYHCEKCDHPWTDVERKKAIGQGEWRSTNPGSATAGFHLNGLYSPWTDLSELVQMFLESKHQGPEALRVFVNTVLAESWEDDQGEAVEGQDLLTRKEKYLDPVPSENIGVLCASADVQADRIEVLVNGYSRDEIWVLGFQIFYGNPASDNLWDQVEGYLKTPWRHPSGKDLRIQASFIDSGYETNQVYKFTKKNSGMGVYAVKGVGGSNRPEVGRPSKSNSARVNVFPIGTNTIKTQIMARLKNKEPGTPGYIHFGDFLDNEFFHQLTAEKMVKKYSKGIPSFEFKRIRPRNEALDLFVYNIGAFTSLNANMDLVQKNLSKVRKSESRKPNPRKGWISAIKSHRQF